MKVMIVKELITGDVSPVAMFFLKVQMSRPERGRVTRAMCFSAAVMAMVS